MFYFSINSNEIKSDAGLTALDTIRKAQESVVNAMREAVRESIEDGYCEIDRVALHSVMAKAAKHADNCRGTLEDYGYNTSRFFATPAEAIKVRAAELQR
jgi:hypothetical protein